MSHKKLIQFFVFLPDDQSSDLIIEFHELQLHQISFGKRIYCPLYRITPGRQKSEGPATELLEAGGREVPDSVHSHVHRAWLNAITQIAGLPPSCRDQGSFQDTMSELLSSQPSSSVFDQLTNHFHQ